MAGAQVRAFFSATVKPDTFRIESMPDLVDHYIVLPLLIFPILAGIATAQLRMGGNRRTEPPILNQSNSSWPSSRSSGGSGGSPGRRGNPSRREGGPLPEARPATDPSWSPFAVPTFDYPAI